jgi:hypothetical protein
MISPSLRFASGVPTIPRTSMICSPTETNVSAIAWIVQMFLHQEAGPNQIHPPRIESLVTKF